MARLVRPDRALARGGPPFLFAVTLWLIVRFVLVCMFLPGAGLPALRELRQLRRRLDDLAQPLQLALRRLVAKLLVRENTSWL